MPKKAFNAYMVGWFLDKCLRIVAQRKLKKEKLAGGCADVFVRRR